jgi:hypothetical protein
VEPARYANSVFINCPFDSSYQPVLRALIFTVIDCGFYPRSALEDDDSGNIRIDKIFRIIEESRYGLHDLSMVKLDKMTRLTRFNMPYELGIFIGAKRFGNAEHNSKRCLVLDTKQFRYRTFISDFSGQDIKSRGNTIKGVIKPVRDWLRDSSNRSTVPAFRTIEKHYDLFWREKGRICKEMGTRWSDITYREFLDLVTEWLRRNA